MNCPDCGAAIGLGMGGPCIPCLIKAVPWTDGDLVRVGERVGRVRYVYYNGYTLVEFPGVPIEGGVLCNNSTFANSQVSRVLHGDGGQL